MVNLSIFKKNFINFLSPINSQIDDVLRHCSGTNIIHDISLLEDFSKRYPNNPKLLYNLSYLFGANNEMQKARDFYNRAFALDERFLDNIFVKIAPGYIQIETVRGCNAACVMCPLENSSTQKRAMKDDVFNKITSEIQKIPHYDPQIALYGLSEPLVDKKLIPRIRRLKKIGISNNLLYL